MPLWLYEAQTVIALIAALAALAAAVVGPVVTYKIAIKQTALAAGIAEHKEWLQEFKSEMSNLISKVRFIHVAYNIAAFDLKGKDKLAMIEISQATDRLLLRLDPTVPSNLEVMNLLHRVNGHLTNETTTASPDFRNLVQSLEDASRQLILSELGSLRGRPDNLVIRKFNTKL